MFLTNSLNLIDIIAIVPYFVTIMVEVFALAEESEIDASGWDESSEGSAILALEESEENSLHILVAICWQDTHTIDEIISGGM